METNDDMMNQPVHTCHNNAALSEFRNQFPSVEGHTTSWCKQITETNTSCKWWCIQKRSGVLWNSEQKLVTIITCNYNSKIKTNNEYKLKITKRINERNSVCASLLSSNNLFHLRPRITFSKVNWLLICGRMNCGLYLN